MPGGHWGLGVSKRRVGIIGATSFVGECLLPLLAQAGCQVVAFSRRVVAQAGDDVEWRLLDSSSSANFIQIEDWICVAPFWALPEYFDLLEAYGARRIVALSSTSRFTKECSSDPEEQAVAHRLANTEERLRAWAESKDVGWVILRPTLIYGRGRDKNISEIARFIRRFGFFPLLGKAVGLRQPVHVEDVASACFAALNTANVTDKAYNISGGETLSYREMVGRVFAAMNCRPRLFSVPLVMFGLALACLRWLPRYRHWSAAMAERMNRDLVFDHADAARDLGFKPRVFVLSAKDVLVNHL